MNSQRVRFGAVGALLACLAIGYAVAADKEVDARKSNAPLHHFRASTIDGMSVRNNNGDRLGSVKDMVIDFETGRVVYAALDFGGFLGIGDKLFAVPWSAFKFHASSETESAYLILNVSKDRLQNAPGFDKNRWPEIGDPAWSRFDEFYAPPKTTQKVR